MDRTHDNGSSIRYATCPSDSNRIVSLAIGVPSAFGMLVQQLYFH
jgi:hypothetical protein